MSERQRGVRAEQAYQAIVAELQIPRGDHEELSLLSCIIVDPSQIDVVPFVEPSDFFDIRCRLSWRVMKELYQDHRKFDVEMLISAMRATPADKKQSVFQAVGGAEFIAEILSKETLASHAPFFAKQIRSLSVKRTVAILCNDAIGECGNEGTKGVEIGNSLLAKLEKALVRGEHIAPVTMDEAMNTVYEQVEAAMKGRSHGISTGFVELDRIRHLLPGEMWIIGGRPSMGKTSLAMNIAEAVAMQRHRVLIFSLEMGYDQLAARMASGRAEVVPKADMTYDQESRRALVRVFGELSSLPITIVDDSSLTADRIAAQSRRIKSLAGVDLIVVDYLQLINPSDHKQPREQQVASAARQLKNVSRQLGIPVIVLAQLNREADTPDPPKLSHLRESGAIEQDADVVAFVHRREVFTRADEDKGKAEIWVRKVRNGPTGVAKLLWKQQYTRFYSPDAEEKRQALTDEELF